MVAHVASFAREEEGIPCSSGIPGSSHLPPCSLQGAGEPMDLGELVGMTPEIIQKVRHALAWWES